MYSGWLLKKGGSGVTPRNWRRRWFVVRDDCIAYYYRSSSVSAEEERESGYILWYCDKWEANFARLT